jgi:hypothetical protein
VVVLHGLAKADGHACYFLGMGKGVGCRDVDLLIDVEDITNYGEDITN